MTLTSATWHHLIIACECGNTFTHAAKLDAVTCRDCERTGSVAEMARERREARA